MLLVAVKARHIAIGGAGCQIASEWETWLLQGGVLHGGSYGGDTVYHEAWLIVSWLVDPLLEALLSYVAPYDRQRNGQNYGRTHAQCQESGQKKEARCNFLGGEECCESCDASGTEHDGDVKSPTRRTQVRLVVEENFE